MSPNIQDLWAKSRGKTLHGVGQEQLLSGTILAERMLPNLDEKYQDGNRPMVMVQKEGSILNAPEFLSFLESLRFFQEVGIMPNRVPWILAEFDTSMILFLLSIVMMRDQKICCFHNRKNRSVCFFLPSG